MRRRAFLGVVGGAVTWPVRARVRKSDQMRRVRLLLQVADNQEGRSRFGAHTLEELEWVDTPTKGAHTRDD